MILRNVLDELINGINTIQSRSLSGQELKDKTVRKDIRENLQEEKILKMGKKPYVRTETSPSDNKMFGYTNKFLMQNNITENSSPDKVNPQDPDSRLHASILEIGSYLAIKRSEISGRSLLNPYQILNRTGITLQNKELKSRIAYISKMITRD